MQLPVTYVWTHDSIGWARTAPPTSRSSTMRPLRAIPGLDFVRPADANETAVAWRTILEHNDRPAGLSLSRQNLPVFDRTEFASAEGAARGGYVLAEASGGTPEVILMGTGSEVQIRRRRPGGAGGRRCPGEGRVAAVLGMVRGPGPGLPRAGAAAHGARPSERRGRCAHGLAGVRRRRRRIVGLDHFGASAAYTVLYEHFGLTADAVVAAGAGRALPPPGRRRPPRPVRTAPAFCTPPPGDR